MNKVLFIDFLCCKEENVFPMIPAGASLDEIIVNEDSFKKKEEKKKEPQVVGEGMELL